MSSYKKEAAPYSRREPGPKKKCSLSRLDSSHRRPRYSPRFCRLQTPLAPPHAFIILVKSCDIVSIVLDYRLVIRVCTHCCIHFEVVSILSKEEVVTGERGVSLKLVVSIKTWLTGQEAQWTRRTGGSIAANAHL